MTTVGDMLKHLGGVPALQGIPFGPESKYYFVDPNSSLASDGNEGTDLEEPLASLEAGEDKLRSDKHDTVFFIAGASADNPTGTITWDKDYAHLIGVGAIQPGVGQRARVVLEAAIAETPTITFSGNGCIVRNMQFNQEKASGAASGTAIVSGLRNVFQRVFFMVPTAVDAASFALKVTGSENTFERCSIGQGTNTRNVASYSLWMASPGNTAKFIDCEFRSWSTGTDHALVKIDNDITGAVYVINFENCLFDNFITGGSGTLTAAIVDSSTATNHKILLRGYNDFTGVTAVANPLTFVLSGRPGSGSERSGHLMITVAES